MLNSVITIRKMKPDDLNFIINSWIKSYANSEFNYLKGDNYPENKEIEIRSIIESSNVLIATPINYPDLIISYICYNDSILEYMYTKFCYRKQGFAKLLWEAAGNPVICTHWRESINDFCEKYGINYEVSN